jgi:hypothetical protein
VASVSVSVLVAAVSVLLASSMWTPRHPPKTA